MEQRARRGGMQSRAGENTADYKGEEEEGGEDGQAVTHSFNNQGPELATLNFSSHS